jgi:sulfate transport system ATP-binding protein
VVVMNHGRIEQIGTPQQVWEQPASPFVYGFLGDVNLLRGRASGGQLQVAGGWQIAAPEFASALDAEAMAFVRPSDLAVAPYASGAPGVAARLDRALVVGPMARLELTPREQPGQILEAHLPSDEYRRLGVQEGQTVLVSPRKARVFLQPAAPVDDPAAMI